MKTIDKFKNKLFPDIEGIELSNKYDFADIAMVLFLSQRLFTFILSSVFGVKGILVFMLSLVAIYIAAIIQRKRQNDNKAVFFFIFTVFLIIALIFISMLRNYDLKFWIFGSEWNFFIQAIDPRKAIFGLLVILLVKDQNRMLRNLFHSSILMLVFLVFQIAAYEYFGSWRAYFTTGDSILKYNMSLGYELVFVTIILFSISMIKRSVALLVLSGVSAGLTFFYGPRGVVVLLISFFLLFLMFGSGNSWKINKKIFKSKLASLFSIILCVLVLILTISVVVPQAKTFINKKHSEIEQPDDPAESPPADDESRTIESITDGSFFTDVGRSDIWSISLRSFLEKPVLGHGFYGDRLSVGYEYNWGYSHNIVLELANQFGLFGLAFLVFLLYLIFRFLTRQSGSKISFLIILFGTMCLKLLISDSYLINQHFWMLLGLLIIGTDLYQITNNKVRLSLIGALVLISIVTAGLFLNQDIKRQEFKIVKISEPTLLFTVFGNSEKNLDFKNTLEKFGFKGTSFINASNLKPIAENRLAALEENSKSVNGTSNEKCNVLDMDDIQEMLSSGWRFEDGGYYNKNPYIRSAAEQEENRVSTLTKFAEYDLPVPLAYNPPYGANNSTVQYRAMPNYTFIQSRVAPNGSNGYSSISYPEALSFKAVKLDPTDDDNFEEVISYLERVKRNNNMAAISVNINDLDVDNLFRFAEAAHNMGFKNINYEDLYDRAYSVENVLGLKNYLENTYIMRIIKGYIK